MGHALGPNEQFDTHGNLSWGSKVGPIRSKGTSKMILIVCFQHFFFMFRTFFTFQKYHFPKGFLGFFYETGHLPNNKTVGNISQGIRYVSKLISAKCTGLPLL